MTSTVAAQMAIGEQMMMVRIVTLLSFVMLLSYQGCCLHVKANCLPLAAHLSLANPLLIDASLELRIVGDFPPEALELLNVMASGCEDRDVFGSHGSGHKGLELDGFDLLEAGSLVTFLECCHE